MIVEDCMDCGSYKQTKRLGKGNYYQCKLSLTKTGRYRQIHHIEKCPKSK